MRITSILLLALILCVTVLVHLFLPLIIVSCFLVILTHIKDPDSFVNDLVMYLFLFVCINTSTTWTGWVLTQASAQGEIFRFDKILVLGQANIYHLFAVLFFLIVFLLKFRPNNYQKTISDKNYLKNIFWIYGIIINILVYLTVYIKGLQLDDLGIGTIVLFFIFLSSTYYIQDVFLMNKNRGKLSKILTIVEAIILFRACYTIVKYLLGLGAFNPVTGGLRLGEEADFADFFILLFVIALTRLLFAKDESKEERMLHIGGIIASSSIAIFSFRRYLWIEFLIAPVIILLTYYRFNKINLNKIIIVCSLISALAMGAIIYIGPDRLSKNYYIGRLLSVMSIVNSKFESQYGTDMGHSDEIKDGWYNVKRNWLLGLTPYGQSAMIRFKTKMWQSGMFVHNAYLLVWLQYGLLGLILFLFLYFKSLQLGYFMFINYQNKLGLILFTFMTCQMAKNLVWSTAITSINVTIMYIFLISLTLRAKRLEDTLAKDYINKV